MQHLLFVVLFVLFVLPLVLAGAIVLVAALAIGCRIYRLLRFGRRPASL